MTHIKKETKIVKLTNIYSIKDEQDSYIGKRVIDMIRATK